jgi:hypothetical protein
MTADQFLAGPILKTITVRLSAETLRQDSDARQEIVLGALAEALAAVDDGSSLPWMVQASPGDEPLLYDLMPLPGHLVSVDVAWEMTDALREHPQIAAAEPTFVLVQDTPLEAASHSPEQPGSTAAVNEPHRNGPLP